MKGHLLMFAGCFVIGKAIYPFPHVLQEGEHSLPVQPRRSVHYVVSGSLTHTWVNTLLPRSACHTSALVKIRLFQNLNVCTPTHCLQNKETKTEQQQNLCYSIPLTSQSLVGRCFHLAWTWNHALSTPLFPLSLLMEWVLLTPWHCSFSLPQFTSTHFTSIVLYFCNCGDPSPSPQIDFPCAPSDLTSIVVFKGQGKPRVPLLLCCLTFSPILKWSFPSRAWIFLS